MRRRSPLRFDRLLLASLEQSLASRARRRTAPPCAPSLTAISDLVGRCADINAGHSEGAGTDPWTAAQLAARNERSCDELLEEWEREAPAFEQILPVINPPRPLNDVVVHEQDMRDAVGVPGGRDSDLFRSMCGRRSAAQIRALGCPEPYVDKLAFLPMASEDVIEVDL